MSRAGRILRIERAQREGYDAWTVGRLPVAIERLELVLAERPGAVETLFPLARALSENGQPERALELLEQAATDREARDAANVYRALLLYDHDDTAGAREVLATLPADNSLGGAILALIDVASGARPANIFTPEQLWLADVAGRLLAVLEARHGERDVAEIDRLHHRFLKDDEIDDDAIDGDSGAEDGDGTEDDDGTDRGADGGEGARAVAAKKATRKNPDEDGPSFDDEDSWQRSIDRLFDEGRFDELVRAYADRRVAESWRDIVANLRNGFALIATGDPKGARRRLAALVEEHAENFYLHFLLGLSEVRCGEARRAAWAFVRSARLADVSIHRILRALLAREARG